MPDVKLECPYCQARLTIRSELAGKKLKCPRCRQSIPFSAPRTAEAEAPPEDDPPVAPAGKAMPAGSDDGNPESPKNRLERLLVLSGGRPPREEFQVPEVGLLRPDVQDTVFFTDLVFTDVGLLVLPYSKASHNAGGNLAVSIVNEATLGLMGLALSIELKHATKKYQTLHGEDAGLAPAACYAKRGMFFPADEMAALQVRPGDNALSVTFRNKTYAFTHWQHTGQTEEQVRAWHAAASAARQKRDGGPPQPGMAALLEWLKRKTTHFPDWLGSAVRNAAAPGRRPATLDLLRSATREQVGRLLEQLRRFAAVLKQPPAQDKSLIASADALRDLVKGQAEKKKKYYIAAVLALCGVILAAVAFIVYGLLSAQ